MAGALLGAVIVAGGCSADVARFDSPFFGFSDQGSSTGSIPVPSEPVRRNVGGPPPSPTSEGGAYFPPPSGRPAPQSGTVRMSVLPDPAPPTPPLRTAPPARPAAVAVAPAYTPAAAPAAAGAPIAGGETIEVHQGDTLYGLSKRHGVSVAALMSANNLTGTALKPGQRLVLPQRFAAAAPRKPLVREAAKETARAAPSLAPSAAAAANWDGTYTVKAGDSPYAIARQHKVSLEELSRVNGIADPRKVMPGAVLKVPGSGSASAGAGPAAAALPAAPQAPVRIGTVTPSAAVPPSAAADVPRVIQTTTQPVILNGAGAQVARADTGTATDATATDAPATPAAPPRAKGTEVASAGSAAVPAAKFRWPVKGKIIAGFGARPDGSHNDGIRVSVPLGTDVHAAENGVVSYAGSELKGYGNLILVRHESGWATAYAHNDQMLVKRGDKVKRGQVIAKAGKTGTVDQPQVHFELRQGSKPIDPAPHMEKM